MRCAVCEPSTRMTKKIARTARIHSSISRGQSGLASRGCALPEFTVVLPSSDLLIGTASFRQSGPFVQTPVSSWVPNRASQNTPAVQKRMKPTDGSLAGTGDENNAVGPLRHEFKRIVNAVGK